MTANALRRGLMLFIFLSTPLADAYQSAAIPRMCHWLLPQPPVQRFNISDELAIVNPGNSLNPLAYQKFQKTYPGDIVDIESERVHFHFQKSTTRKTKSTRLRIAGLGGNLLRSLSNPLRQQVHLQSANELNIEAPGQGGTLFEFLLRNSMSVPTEIRFAHVRDTLVKALEEIRDVVWRKHKIDIYDSLTIEGLSWGGWTSLALLADPAFNQFVKVGVFLDPGLLDLGMWLHPDLYYGTKLYDTFRKIRYQALSLTPLNFFMESDHSREQRRLTDVRDATMAYMFDRFHVFQEGPHYDPYLLEGAASMFMGIRDVNVLELIPQIPTRIPLHFFIAGNGDVIPPSLYIALIDVLEQSKAPDQQFRGSMILLEDVEHDIAASTRPDVQKLIASYSGETENQGYWMLTKQGTLIQLSKQELVGKLLAQQKVWEAKNKTLTENRWHYVHMARRMRPSSNKIQELSEKHLGSQHLLSEIFHLPDSQQLFKTLHEQALTGARLWQYYRQFGDRDAMISELRRTR